MRGLETERRRPPSSQTSLPPTSWSDEYAPAAVLWSRKMPPLSSPARWLTQLCPFQRETPSPERTSRSGEPLESDSRSDAVGPAGPPIGLNSSPAPAIRKTPADVTRIGDGKGAA